MQTWKDILTAAVVGTGQQDFLLAPSNDELGTLLSQVDGGDREQMLLQVASIMTLYRRAGGMQPTDRIEPLTVCTPEERPRVSRDAGRHLQQMLQGEFKSVLPEWLRAVDKIGARVSEEHLPALFEEGRGNSSLRELIVPVLGKRGEWLSAQNPDWNYVTLPEGEDVWQIGTHEQRLFVLERLRKSDLSAGRSLLAKSWLQESARDRAAFLEKFALDVTPDDEEFLNGALEDRSADVRRVARAVLSRLPKAKFTRRISNLTSRVMNFKKPLLGKARIEVSLPDDPLAWLKEQEIEIDSPPRSNAAQALGPKAWCLKELVAYTPVTYWVELWKKSPVEIVYAAFESEWATAFSEGLVRAVRRDRDPEWIEALIAHWLNDSKPEITYSSPIELSAYLPESRLEALILLLMKAASKGLNDTHAVLQFLLVHRGQWSDQLSRLVIGSIKKRIPGIRKDETIDWQTRSALKKFAHHISPALYDELAQGWPMASEAWPSWAKAVDEFQSLLAFRRDIYNALRSAT